MSGRPSLLITLRFLLVGLGIVAFGALHLFNEGITPMTAISVTLLGMLWTGLFLLTRNLWVCTLHHAAWNFTIFTTGLPLSGNEDWRAVAPFESASHGAQILTGGAFGPEDSILNVTFVLLAVIGILVVVRRRGALVGRAGSERPSAYAER